MTGQDFLKFDIPDAPGVYFFKKKNGILYIGRATSLRDRVRSYFGNDLIHTRGPLLIDMVTQSDTLEWQETGSVLESIILESNLIKQHQPHYNTKEKDNRSFNYIIITKEEFPRVLLVRGRNLEKIIETGESVVTDNFGYDIKEFFGPYTNGQMMREALKIVRKIFPYRDTCTPAVGKPCFNRQIALCPGVCTGEINADEYAKTVRRITLFLRGKSDALLAELNRDMNTYAMQEKFEQANEVKKMLYAISHIQDVALIKKETAGSAASGASSKNTELGYRIEGYDIAHIAGKHVVGVMVVIRNGMPDKTEYRKFRMKSGIGNNDIAHYGEMLARRFARTDWPMPDLIVIDGGIAQLSAAQDLVEKMGEKINTREASKPAIVSVVKDIRHAPREILGMTESVQVATTKDAILLANHEAHRFAITYHKLLRKKAFLNKAVKRYTDRHVETISPRTSPSRRPPRRA